EPQGVNVIRLSISKGIVKTGSGEEIEDQGYLLRIAPGHIEITGNADQGLYYGVQTLLQLMKPGPRGSLLLPQCSIEDWPALQLRFLHWDTKHHQDRLETLKRYLDWSARFKVNMIGFELEDKFEYPSHPAIGAPGAFTVQELQSIVDYGLERFIQVVPQIQSPAHMAYVLKHPEFADLRSDGNNYQACLCDERTYKLIFSMFDDVIKATRGVKYFHVSTDEVYYAGICPKCDKPYNPENRSLRWVEFANRAHEFLSGYGRRMLAWVEYPVLTRHIHMLPSDLINGVMSDDARQTNAEDARGIRQLIYTSMQGEEDLFPGYLMLEDAGRRTPGRLETAFDTILSKAGQGHPIGVYGAAWDDSGLHNETFWMGWAAVARYGWRPGVPSVEQHVAEFMNAYYGPRVTGMAEVYRGLQAQAHFFDDSWDRVVSKVRGPAYGNSEGKGIGTRRWDQTLPAPSLPTLPGLDFKPVYAGHYGQLAVKAGHMLVENDSLLQKLHENISKADRNRYNLEVFLSIAELAGHHDRMIAAMKTIEDTLQEAQKAARSSPRRAAGQLAAAYNQAREVVLERNRAFEYVKTVWEKSHFPKGREVNGRKFLHVMDDTKDHRADRRADLSYLIAPEESMGVEGWMNQLAVLIRQYAKSNNLPAPDLP
ncbi:MAG TPA: family 20 glycosylhydrolase, partial [Acidobacteriota bacterium]|nr:family 20 glycosylhydrolase [Acidobacteriota bacterium]